jgi:hypothetical protein
MRRLFEAAAANGFLLFRLQRERSGSPPVPGLFVYLIFGFPPEPFSGS